MSDGFRSSQTEETDDPLLVRDATRQESVKQVRKTKIDIVNGRSVGRPPFLDEAPPRILYDTLEVASLGIFVLTPAVRAIVRRREAHDPFALGWLGETDRLRALVYLVAICDRVNWDFLMGTFAERLWVETDGLRPERILALNAHSMKRLHHGYHRKSGDVGFKRKARLLHAVASHDIREQLVSRLTTTKTIWGKGGVIDLLENAPAFEEDPLHKKSNILAQELVRRKLIQVRDGDSLEPAVDHHIIRIYLRTGRVSVVKPEFKDRLVRRGPMRIEALTMLREKVAEALRYTSHVTGVALTELNDAEWAFAREFCGRDKAVCTESLAACPFSSHCPSAGKPVSEMPTEPVSNHGHY